MRKSGFEVGPADYHVVFICNREHRCREVENWAVVVDPACPPLVDVLVEDGRVQQRMQVILVDIVETVFSVQIVGFYEVNYLVWLLECTDHLETRILDVLFNFVYGKLAVFKFHLDTVYKLVKIETHPKGVDI